jgi:hypothetical protein
MKCMVDARRMDALCCTLKNGDACASNGEVARQEGRRRAMVVIVLLQRIGTGRGRAEFPMQVQGVRPKAVHQDRHASGRAMVAAAAYMALIARHLRILAVRSSISALQLACYTRRHGLQVIEVPPPSRIYYSFLSGG